MANFRLHVLYVGSVVFEELSLSHLIFIWIAFVSWAAGEDVGWMTTEILSVVDSAFSRELIG